MKFKLTGNSLITVDICLAAGMSPPTAEALVAAIESTTQDLSPRQAWSELTRSLLSTQVPFPVHATLFKRLVSLDQEQSAARGVQPCELSPFPAWSPSPRDVAQAQVTRMATRLGLKDYPSLWSWANQNRMQYWHEVAQELNVVFDVPPPPPIPEELDPKHPHWFAGAQLNIADSCFQAEADKLAIRAEMEDGTTSSMSYGELQKLVNQVGNGLLKLGLEPGDRVGLLMPMTPTAVAIFLGIVRCGCVPVPIAESFAAPEIQVRLQLADAKCMIVADVLKRGGKRLPCYAKFEQTSISIPTVIVPHDSVPQCTLPPGCVLWSDFIHTSQELTSYAAVPHAESCILFSSGTTGIPKAIPWTHTTPIKCAADARFHQNVHSESVACWPTSLGWMMGPWLVYGTLMNRGTLALYCGSPVGKEFCQFVERSQVTMLGVIPSLVRTWRQQDAVADCDWGCIEAFSSTGECSSADDMLYLMSRANYRPMLEYCGGTEIGGGYVAATTVQPCVPSVFSTPALGLDFRLINSRGADGDIESDIGEVFLVPPSVGLSDRLLNADHDEIYYTDAPVHTELGPLRRHGDQLERLAGGYFRACGRTDDTMNLGGIKISSVEIERCLNQNASIVETAAIGLNVPGGGPTQLIIFAVVLPHFTGSHDELRASLQAQLRQSLNPLFRIHQVEVLEALPRTASNKILRRELRDTLSQGESHESESEQAT